MKKRRIDIDYVTPATAHSLSLLYALGYEVEKVKEGDTKDDDMFMVYYKGKHIPFYNKKKHEKVPKVKRTQIYQFARNRHDNLRQAPLERKILYCID